jgi:hypothetical protein
MVIFSTLSSALSKLVVFDSLLGIVESRVSSSPVSSFVKLEEDRCLDLVIGKHEFTFMYLQRQHQSYVVQTERDAFAEVSGRKPGAAYCRLLLG